MSISNDSINSKLRKLIARKIPVILIHCPNDTFVPYANTVELVQQFGQEFFELETCVDGGHMPHEKYPDLVKAIMQKHNLLD